MTNYRWRGTKRLSSNADDIIAKKMSKSGSTNTEDRPAKWGVSETDRHIAREMDFKNI